MTKRNQRWIVLLLVFTLLAGCATVEEASRPSPTPEPEVSAPPESTPEPTPSPEERIAALVSELTVEEKVGQLLVSGIEGTTPGEDARVLLEDYRVGGLILFSRNVESSEQLTALNKGLKAMNGSGLPLLLGVDEEGGAVSRMPPEVGGIPSALDWVEQGLTGESRGKVLAERCRTFGFNLDFAPVLDVWSNPENRVIGHRAFGTEPEVVTREGVACMEELLAAGVIPVVKHFPGHGDTKEDSHTELPVVDKSREELEACELIPFRAAIEAGAPAVMVAHLLMTDLDPDNPATLSPAVVDGLLRTELGFDGVVVTDDLTMGALDSGLGVGETAVRAVEAGCDLLLLCHQLENTTQVRNALLDAVASGRISTERLDRSVSRVLALKHTVTPLF